MTLICDSNPERELQYLEILPSGSVEGILPVPVGTPDEQFLMTSVLQGSTTYRACAVRNIHASGTGTVQVPIHQMECKAARLVLDGRRDSMRMPTRKIRGRKCRKFAGSA